MDELVEKVKQLFAAYHVPGHDIKHALRVSVLAKKLAQAEGYDENEAAIAGLLHDIGRTVKNPQKPHAHEGVPIARKLLDTYTQFAPEVKERILTVIAQHSDKKTKGALNHIIQDADKLDGMGAIGISRAYMSLHGQPDYHDDEIIPKAGDYAKFKSAHELIVFTMQWYSMLYTDSAKTMGKPRYEFMKQYLNEIKKEIEESS